MKDLRKFSILALALGSLNTLAEGWLQFDGTPNGAMTIIEANSVHGKSQMQLALGTLRGLTKLNDFVPEGNPGFLLPFRNEGDQWLVQTSYPLFYQRQANLTDSTSVLPRSELQKYFDEPEVKEFFAAINQGAGASETPENVEASLNQILQEFFTKDPGSQQRRDLLSRMQDRMGDLNKLDEARLNNWAGANLWSKINNDIEMNGWEQLINLELQ